MTPPFALSTSAAAAPVVIPNKSQSKLWLSLAVWVFILATLGTFRVRPLGELWAKDGFDWQVKFQAASWVALGLLAVVLALAGRADLRLLRRGPLYWYAGFVLLALFSAVLAPNPLLTVFRSAQLAIALLLVISLRDHLKHIYLFICIFLGLNWAILLLGALGIGTELSWIRPPSELFEFHRGTRDDPWRFSTAFGHPSQISILAAVAAVGLAARAKGRGWLTLGPVIVFCIVTNFMTVSRTGILGMLAGFVVVAANRRRLLPLTVLAGVIVPLALWPERVQNGIVRYMARGQDAKALASVTGRDAVFAESWRRVVDSAFLGEGFGASRTHLLAERWGASHAHNLFLQATTSLGLLGLVLVTFSVATFLRDMWLLRRAQGGQAAGEGAEFAAVAVPYLAFCLLDSGFASMVDPSVLMFLALTARLRSLREPALAAGVASPPSAGPNPMSPRRQPLSSAWSLPQGAAWSAQEITTLRLRS